jgi:glutamate synthase domain-containing protein 2
MSDFPPHPADPVGDVLQRHQRRDPARGGLRHLRHSRRRREAPVPHFDDLLFLGASISRYPLEGYRETCGTDVWLGTRHAKNPIELDIPITIAGMSFGALSGPAKEALGRGATLPAPPPPPAMAA